MKPTERDIQRALWLRNHQRFNVLMPNYTPQGWWECDVFGVTKSCYFHEFEIKLTVADFNKDARKKRRDSWQWIGGEKQTITGRLKHTDIGQGIGPARFWYVTPAGLLDIQKIPEWAGWQTYHASSLHTSSVYIRIQKQAPQLHRVKIDDKIVRHSMAVCYYRYWHERNEHDDSKRSHATVLQMMKAAAGEPSP